RVGEELHDNVGQLLSVVKWQLGVLEEEKIPQISEVSETVGKAIHELRALSKSLDGDVVKDFGLVSSLQHELGRIEYAGKCRTHLHVAGERGQADVQKEMVLFRIAQEVLNNALKHAHAQHLSVSLQYTPNTLLFSIEDDGKGFEMTAVKSRPIEASGAGLRNIQRRAELLGGTCRIESEIGGGTKVLLEIPL
nr:ATP-binding protein [Spirosomataceae bacterium]